MKKARIHYPLAERHADTLKYMNNLDWDRIRKCIHKDIVAHFDISNAVDIFPHLKLDSNYSLFCYVSNEYHGLWGRVAAVRNCCDVRPRIIREDGLFGPQFDFPRYSFEPMEAIYNDGTPEGYLEALVLAGLLSSVPFTHHKQDHRDQFIDTSPPDFHLNWNIYEKIPTWTPLLIEDDEKVVVFICRRHFENGIGASNGLDSISIHKCTFYPTLARLHKFDTKLFHEPVPRELRAWIRTDSRYSPTHRCSACKDVGVLIAQEKEM